MKHFIVRLLLAAGVLGVGVFLLNALAANAQVVPPTSPTGLTATLLPPYQVSLSWSVPVNASSVAGYYLYRNGAQIASTGGTSYTDSLPAGQGYYTYSVAAYGPGGGAFSQSPSIPFSVTPDTTPPTAPTNLTITAITSSSIALSWNAATDNVGVAGYYLIKNGAHVPMTTPLTGTTYTDIGLTAGSTQNYKVAAYDAAQNVSPLSNTVTATTFPAFFSISPPFSLTATAVSVSEIDLAWSGSTSASGTPAYNIYRNGVAVASTTGTSYADTSLSAGTGYGYYVTAFDGVGNFSTPSNNAATSTFPAPASASTASTSSATTTSHYTPSIEPTIILGPQGPTFTTDAPASPSVSSSSPSSTTPLLTTTLYLGLRGTAVTTLQNILIAQGDLSAIYATGYFGALTQKAVQKFQCAENIVCSGSSWTTGWGMVGARTRAALNAL